MYKARVGTSLELAQDFLSQGELVAIPTETVYGLAANALEPYAVIKIFEAKNRPQFNPLIVHGDSLESLTSLLKVIPPQAIQLAEAFWPGPLTLLLPRTAKVPDLVTAGSDRVAVRVPGHPLTLSLLASLPFPLAAPSANPFGYISPTRVEHVQEQLGQKIPYILDGGACEIGVESSIVGFDKAGNAELYRSGGISAEAIEAILGAHIPRFLPAKTQKPTSSGQLKSHYAPHTPLILGDLEALLAKHGRKNVGILAFSQALAGIPLARQRILSPSANLAEAAKNLFAAMHELDGQGVDLVLAELVPNTGLGRAINDRLKRAQAKNKA